MTLALSQNFNDQKGSPWRSSAAIAEHFSNVLEDLDLQGVDIDVISQKLGDTGNEAAMSELMDIADTSSGELGKNSALERDVDESVLAKSGSRSKNLSDESQTMQEHLIHGDFNFNTPALCEENDIELAIQRTVEILAEAGVPESELNMAMAAGGVDNNFGTLEAMKDLAKEFEVPEAQGYLNLVEMDMAQMGIGAKAHEFTPAFAANDPKFDLEQQQRMQPAAMRMG